MLKNTRRLFLQSLAASTLLPLQVKAANMPDERLKNYEMPMEDQPHERTFLQWPVEVDVYGARDLKRTQKTIAAIANAVSEFEPVVLMAAEEHHKAIRAQVSAGVELWNIPTNDLWARDSGPTFVKNHQGELAVSQIQFNGWGEKQVNNHDKHIAAKVAEKLGLPYFKTGIVGEQGGVEHDGAGTMMAHASCWVNPNRSTETADQIAQRLGLALGAKKMIWTPGLIGHDITDYHIDALARFVGPGKVLIQLGAERDENEPYSNASYETYEILKQSTSASGQALDIIVLPEPLDIRSTKKDFVNSYVNFYVCNGAVIGAQFGDKKADDHAKGVLADLYPGRKIVALNVDTLGESGGGIHCATQQQPKAG